MTIEDLKRILSKMYCSPMIAQQILSAWEEMEVKYQQAENRLGDAIERIDIYKEQIAELNVALQNQMQCVGELKEFLHNLKKDYAELKADNESLRNCWNCAVYEKGRCSESVIVCNRWEKR